MVQESNSPVHVLPSSAKIENFVTYVFVFGEIQLEMGVSGLSLNRVKLKNVEKISNTILQIIKKRINGVIGKYC